MTRTRFFKRLALSIAGAGLIGASAAAYAADAVPDAAKAEAKQIFDTRCMTCHGAAGKGDGPAAAGLNPKPRDLSDPAWQTSVTDEHIEKIIAQGGPAVGKSVMMPGNPDLVSKPDVIKGLRLHVRGLSK